MRKPFKVFWFFVLLFLLSVVVGGLAGVFIGDSFNGGGFFAVYGFMACIIITIYYAFYLFAGFLSTILGLNREYKTIIYLIVNGVLAIFLVILNYNNNSIIEGVVIFIIALASSLVAMIVGWLIGRLVLKIFRKG